MKKYFFLLLSVVLFAACGNDDDIDPGKKDDPGNNSGNRPEKVAEYDLTDMLKLDAQGVEKKWGEAVMDFGTLKAYEFSKGGINKAIVIFNGKTNLVYSIVANLNADVYTPDQVKKYFASWLTPIEEDGKIYYVDNTDYEKATIVVNVYYEVDDETGETFFTIDFINPQNQPETPEGGEALEMNADDIVKTFMDGDLDEILDSYDCFMQFGDGYYSAEVDDELVSYVALSADESGTVRVISILYENAEDDDEVIAYYRNLGFTIIYQGEDTDDEGNTYEVYKFQGKDYSVIYCDQAGTIISGNLK